MNNKMILTGAMGAGKSTMIAELRKHNIHCIDEPARQILAEQRKINGSGVPETDPRQFCELLLERSIEQYKNTENTDDVVIFDRGIADNIAYFELFKLDPTRAINATKLHPYHTKVLFLPAWEAIYTTDDERKMSFDQAKRFGESIQSIYHSFDYELIEIPKVQPNQRVQYILDVID